MILSRLSCLCARQQALIHFLQTSSRDKVLEMERILRVPDQNGVSRPYNMLEMHHSGPEPSI